MLPVRGSGDLGGPPPAGRDPASPPLDAFPSVSGRDTLADTSWMITEATHLGRDQGMADMRGAARELL